MNKLVFKQFAQYVVVGGLAFLVDFAILYFLTDKAGLHYLASASIAFLVGLLVNYALCVVWIFEVRAIAHRGHEFAVFSIIGLVGLVLNNGLLYVLTDQAGLHYLLSKMFAAGVILIFNFGMRRAILFTERQKSPRRPGGLAP